MYIRWSSSRIAEQHLEGDCKDLEKLKLEIHVFEGNGDGTGREWLARVTQVDSVSDGTLRIYIDASKENP